MDDNGIPLRTTAAAFLLLLAAHAALAAEVRLHLVNDPMAGGGLAGQRPALHWETVANVALTRLVNDFTSVAGVEPVS